MLGLVTNILQAGLIGQKGILCDASQILISLGRMKRWWKYAETTWVFFGCLLLINLEGNAAGVRGEYGGTGR